MIPRIWEKQGVDQVKADLAGGKYGPRRRVAVDEWLREKKQERQKQEAKQGLSFPMGVATGLAAALALFLLLH
jgi:hypothetical protein